MLAVTVKRADGSKKDLQARVSEEGLLGVQIGGQSLVGRLCKDRGLFQIETKKYSFLESIPAGINKGVETLS